MNIEITRNVSLIETNKIDNSKVIYIILKRTLDIIFALVGCVILVPLTLFIWLANSLSKDKGPIFYTQKRIGKNGKIFKLYKFRSMVVDADELLKKYLQDNPIANEEYNKYRKLKDDPRVTKVGEFIRKTSIDEFPQFINILKGEMSLIGPRPMLEEELLDNADTQKILNITPGLTGYWATNGRNNTTCEERIKMELYYVKNANFKLDIKIFFKTIVAVIKRDGAM